MNNTHPKKQELPLRHESERWEQAYLGTRRNLGKRIKRLKYFEWAADAGKILDLGAGDGLDQQALEQLGYECILLDLSISLLKGATGDRVVGDAHCLPFGDGSLEVILANSVLHHLDFPKALPELVRVMSPHGRLLLMEPRPCLARWLLDQATGWFGPIGLTLFLKARWNALEEERVVYERWLRQYPQLETRMRVAGLVKVRQRKTWVGILSQWVKSE